MLDDRNLRFDCLKLAAEANPSLDLKTIIKIAETFIDFIHQTKSLSKNFEELDKHLDKFLDKKVDTAANSHTTFTDRLKAERAKE